MEIDPISILIATLQGAISVINHFSNRKGDRTKDEEAVLLSLSDAFHATEGYYDLLKEHPKRDRTKEWEIAEKWNVVAIRIADIDKPLSQRLQLKSRYWREGAMWSDDAIRQAGIKLDHVWVEINGELRKHSE